MSVLQQHETPGHARWCRGVAAELQRLGVKLQTSWWTDSNEGVKLFEAIAKAERRKIRGGWYYTNGDGICNNSASKQCLSRTQTPEGMWVSDMQEFSALCPWCYEDPVARDEVNQHLTLMDEMPDNIVALYAEVANAHGKYRPAEASRLVATVAGLDGGVQSYELPDGSCVAELKALVHARTNIRPLAQCLTLSGTEASDDMSVVPGAGYGLVVLSDEGVETLLVRRLAEAVQARAQAEAELARAKWQTIKPTASQQARDVTLVLRAADGRELRVAAATATGSAVFRAALAEANTDHPGVREVVYDTHADYDSLSRIATYMRYGTQALERGTRGLREKCRIDTSELGFDSPWTEPAHCVGNELDGAGLFGTLQTVEEALNSFMRSAKFGKTVTRHRCITRCASCGKAASRKVSECERLIVDDNAEIEFVECYSCRGLRVAAPSDCIVCAGMRGIRRGEKLPGYAHVVGLMSKLSDAT